MKLVLERLPEATVVSVGHRPELERFHPQARPRVPPDGARLACDESLEQWTFHRTARSVAIVRRERTARAANAG